VTKSDIFCEHANENPNHCKCPPDCICWTATCKDKGPDLAGAVAYDPYVKDQRRLRDLAKLAYEYGDENLRERLNPSRFGVSCSGPLGLVSEEEAVELVVENLTPGYLIEGEVDDTSPEGWFMRITHPAGIINKIDDQVAVDADIWDEMSEGIADLSKKISSKVACVMRFVELSFSVSGFSKQLALRVTLKPTPDLEINTYYSTRA
jgi:hypothetical protein